MGGQVEQVDKLLVIKDKVTEEHKLVDEWTRWTKRQDNRRTVLIQNESVSKIKYPFQM